MRVALATNYIPPYRIPLYSELGSTPGWDFRVFCSSESEFDRQWVSEPILTFCHKISFSVSYKRTVTHTGRVHYKDIRQVHLPIGLWFDLWKYRPDIVVSLEMGMRSLIAATYCRIAGKPLILWFYGTSHTERHISWRQRILRKVLTRMANAFIGMGHDTRLYLESLGISGEKIFDAKNGPDLSRWERSVTLDERITTRRRLGIADLCYLYVGRLIPLKGINYLLDAWNLFCKQDGVKATLLLVGDGEQKEILMHQAAKLRLNNVRFARFTQPENLPSIYQAADIFVFPTLQDAYSVVIGEALASGLPVIGSKYDGASADLIVDGINGWIADPLDVNDLSRKLVMAWEARERKEEMGKAARKLISSIDISHMANGFRKAIMAVLG
jgi:glycosyltransferase involved in cell wall biosynthesis